MFLIVANQMVIMFILIMIGFMIRRVKLIDHDGSKTLSNVLLLLVNPVLIMNSFLTVEYDVSKVRNLFVTFLFAVLTHLLGIIASRLLLSGREDDTRIARYSAVYSNCGFMGIPLINSVLGAEGVFYITAYLVVFNFLTWTHGLILITGDASPKQLARGLRSPVMFTMLAGMIFYFCRIHIPANIGSALTYVANMNTPLGMFVAGAALAEAHPLEALKKKQVYLVALAKLIIMPVLAAAVMLPFHPADVVYYTVVAAAASPVATTCTMMALRYDKNYHYASELYVVTTMMSMLTIPAVMAIAQMLF
ncbi:MAG: AEC family transporter [Lachnospiraceae bacterium]|nr:AEC family transporter [Lachnospiraceae bacterium]